MPVGGGDNSPTTVQRVYDIGDPIDFITDDVIARYESGDPWICNFIEETSDNDTQEVTKTVAPGDVESTEAADEHIRRMSGAPEELKGHTVSELKQIAEEKGVELPAGAKKADIVEALASEDNPFAEA